MKTRHVTLSLIVVPTLRLRAQWSLRRQFHNSLRNHVSNTSETIHVDTSVTRNIGIIAHIDAGKTTTTERMLYYSGHTRRIGDVDEGSTVTDFLPAERARGITIQSAAISFYWPPFQSDTPSHGTFATSSSGQSMPRSLIPHRINLIDTPGHADFTFEVRRSLRVLDGAICVLDGVAGVEAQTEQVWKQANEWNIPKIVYVNKLDRVGAAFGRTVREVALRLGGWPALCQIPWFRGGKGDFCGIGDVINLCGLLYEAGGDGKTIRRLTLAELDREEPKLAEEIRKARTALVELLSEHDEKMVEVFFEADESHMSISPVVLLESLRRCLLTKRCPIIPIFAGASFRNIGVQPLLDAVNNMLPSPVERPDSEVSLGNINGNLAALLRGELALETSKKPKGKVQSTSGTAAVMKTLKGCALAFKVVSDPRKGVLVYIRVYSGSIDRNALLYNTNTRTSEKAMTLLRMYANESVPVQSIEAGQIGVIAGSKNARTGDTLIACTTNKAVPPEPLDKLQLRPIHVPPPVFFASIEPNSLKDERDMHEKLAILLREDPSLHVNQDEDTGQTLLSGMGELHLEIARDRLVNDLRANATMGKIAIGYRETFVQPSGEVHKTYDSASRGDSKGKAGCSARVEPLTPELMEMKKESDSSNFYHEQDGNVVLISAPSLDSHGRPLNDDAVGIPNNLTLHEIQSAYLNGALAALARGPSYSYPVRNVCLTLTLDPANDIFGNETSYSALTAAARLSAIAAFRDTASAGGGALMEPVMNVDISIDDASLGSVVQDISSSRGGQILSLGDNEEANAQAENSASGSTTRQIEIDLARVYAPQDPFEFGDASKDLDNVINKQRSIKARVPLKEMVGYLKHLRSITGGRGTFTMSVDRFDRMSGQREKALLAELQGGY